MKRLISPARYLRILAMVAIGLSAVVVIMNWEIDPLQFFRRADYPPQLSSQARFQNPGLAKHYPYDCPLLGTSVSIGFDLGEIDRVLHCQSIGLAMHGASAREQRLLLDVALRTGKPRRVLWDLNYEFLRGRPDWVSDFDGTFPSYLYDTNPFNEVPNYLLNIDATKASWRVILERFGWMQHRGPDLVTLNQLDLKRVAGRQSLEQAWQRARKGDSFFKGHAAEFNPPQPSVSFDQNYLSAIRSHPNIAFDLWIPPHSIAYFALMREFAPSAFEEMFNWKRHLFIQTRQLPNVRLHDFQGDAEIVLEADRYLDTVHFDSRTHSQIISAIASASHVATAESLDEAERLLRKEATPEWLARR